MSSLQPTPRPGQWDEAQRRSEQALELAKGEYHTLERMCLELYRLHEPYRAFPPELVAKRRPSTPGEELLYAIVKNSIGNRKEAIADLRRVIERNPRFIAAHYELGVLLCSENLLEAVTYLSRCLELDPNSSDALYRRANADVRLGKYSEALVDAKTAHTLNPKDDVARFVHAWALASLGQLDQAFQELGEISQEYSEDAWLHALRGHCYLVEGRFTNAVAELTEAIRYYPSDVLAYSDRAVALSALGKTDEGKHSGGDSPRLAPALRAQTEARITSTKKK